MNTLKGYKIRDLKAAEYPQLCKPLNTSSLLKSKILKASPLKGYSGSEPTKGRSH